MHLALTERSGLAADGQDIKHGYWKDTAFLAEETQCRESSQSTYYSEVLSNEDTMLQRDQPPTSVVQRILMRMFGRPQGLLGRVGGIIMARMNQQCASWVIDLLNIQPHERVLEVGFGPGVGIQLLARAASAGYIAGVDASEAMVAQATARNRQAIERGRVDVRHGSVERLPFADHTFDKALAINSMQVWPDAVTGLREMWRVLKPGGRVALAFTPYAGQPKSGVAAMLTAAAFTEVHVVETELGFCVLALKP